MSDYTPTTEDVLNCLKGKMYRHSFDDTTSDGFLYAHFGSAFSREQVDRWLTEHDRQVKAEAWDEGYDASVMDSRQPVSAKATGNPYREVSE